MTQWYYPKNILSFLSSIFKRLISPTMFSALLLPEKGLLHPKCMAGSISET